MKTIKLALLLAQATALFGQYQYFLSDTFSSIDTNKWTVYGNPVATSQGLAPSGAILLSKLGGGQLIEEEVKTTLAFDQGQAQVNNYLRAYGPPDNLSYYLVQTAAGWPSAGQCSFWVYKRFGQTSLLAQGGGICHDGSTIRTMVHSSPGIDASIDIYIDDQLVAQVIDTAGLQFGSSGVGVGFGWISRVDIGALEHIAPNPVNPATIGKSVWANRVDLQWQPATDNLNGIGVAWYELAKNGTFISGQSSLSYSDQTLIPGVTYTYTLYAIDFHGNWSTGTSFNVTTPGVHPNFAIPTPPARTGIRPTGAYWGAGSEHIDMMSGNLNWTLPLLKAQGRSGWGVGFNLTYNSQIWRKDSGGTWNLGMDVGYGYGWRLMAGSVVPYWSDPYTIHHYIYSDSTGADYKLDVNTNGIWTSTEGIYVAYDPAGPKLIFTDGSVWTMGCESGGNEPDIGVRYPTRMQDTNGNYILIHYQTGRSAAFGDTSARIASIDDVRDHPEYSNPYTYTFSYNSDPTPHLTSITNYIGTAESYTFTYIAGQAVSSPFGYDPGSAVTASLLQRATNSNAIDHTFEYSGGWGELTRVILPYGASLKWTYRSFTFTGGKTVREVQYRYLSKQSGAPDQQYWIWRDDAHDANGNLHYVSAINDPTGASKSWSFGDDPLVWWNGLLYGYFEYGPGQVNLRQQLFNCKRLSNPC